MKQTILIVAIINIALGAFLLSKKYDAEAMVIKPDPITAKRTYQILGAIYMFTALTLIATLPNV